MSGKLLNEVKENFKSAIETRGMKVELNVDDNVFITCNSRLLLLFSRICLKILSIIQAIIQQLQYQLYNQDEKFYHFSFSDNGVGIPEEHLGTGI